MKFCPILKAGTMLSLLSADVLIRGEVNIPQLRASYDTATCLRERCEWYGKGCPAYPSILYTTKGIVPTTEAVTKENEDEP